MRQILEHNSKQSYTIFDRLHAKLCGRVYLFLYRLTSLCEDRKLKHDVEKALREAEQNAVKVEFLEENKETILGGIEALKQRICELEAEVKYYKDREMMVGNSLSEIAFLNEIIERVFVMSRLGSIEEINRFLTEIKLKG